VTTEPGVSGSQGDFQLGEWRVQPSLGQVDGPSGSFRLEPKVMEVLVYLARRPRQLVTKDELLETVWKDTFVADGALFRHVSELRRILGDDSKEPRYIQTIPKKGYRLVAPVSYEGPGHPSNGAEGPSGVVAGDLTAAPAEAVGSPGDTAPSGEARSVAWLSARRAWVWIAAAFPLLALYAILARAPSPGPGVGSSKPSLAVLHFQNLSGDSSLDWLRVGLAEMLVTDLSQSPRLEVLGADRMHQILAEVRPGDTLTSDFLRKVAEKAGVRSLVVGSFVKAGDTIRISAQLQDAATGRILLSDSIDGTADARLFSMVDVLTQHIRGRIEGAPKLDLDRDLKEVTTASLEAYRYYVEGMSLHSRHKEDEARVPLERALAVDPSFAMAAAKLSIVFFNIGQDRRAAEFAERAIAHLDRLPPKERYYIEGWYYVRQEATLGRAEEAYRTVLELYPDHHSARGSLGAVYTTLERYDEAVSQLERLRRDGVNAYAPSLNLAKCYAALGRPEQGQAVLQSFRDGNPDNSAVHRSLGFQLIANGKLDDAMQMFATAERLEPADLGPEGGRLVISVLREDWAAARAAAAKLALSPDPYYRWLGHMAEANLSLYRGRSGDALAALERAATSDAESGERVGLSRATAARVLLLRDEPARAALEAQKAQREAPGNPGEWQGLFAEALGEEALGQHAEADRVAQMLKTKADLIPSDKEKRRFLHLSGELALSRGEVARAIAELESAEATLSRGVSYAGSEIPQHVPIWFSLASAHLVAGDRLRAAKWLTRIADSGLEHVHWPVPYAQSQYLLGTVHEAQGEQAKARARYERFLSLWGEGDLSRAWVESARRKTGRRGP
jgi:DNA-binding winged helix-turn-helix (wHTH) protein/TolB-like protein/tetratricopeptide (TPR) repeat protein